MGDLAMVHLSGYIDLRIAHVSRCMALGDQRAEGKISPLDRKEEINQNLLCLAYN